MRTLWIRLVLAELVVASSFGWAATPATVSPGSRDKLAVIDDRCPTFSWDAAAGSQAHELVVYRVEEEGVDLAEPVLKRALPGSASSWTPSLQECFERDQAYAWSVRAIGRERDSDWTRARLFQVAAGPSDEEFRRALELVRSYVEAPAGQPRPSGDDRVRRSSGNVADAIPASIFHGSQPPQALGGSDFSVDESGNVEATSFTGVGAVPSGAVMFFDSAPCPTGWTELALAQGRAIVGTTGGTVRGIVGTALGDLEDRGHSHAVNPALATASSSGSHLHAVDPPNQAGTNHTGHSHSVDPPNASSTSDSHNHRWSQYNNGGWVAYDSSGIGEVLTNWGNGVGNEGAGWEPLAVFDGHGFANYFTLADTHSHSTNISSFVSSLGGLHTHTVDIPTFNSGTIGSHTHDIDLPNTNSSSETTSQVIPYLQLLVCRKD